MSHFYMSDQSKKIFWFIYLFVCLFFIAREKKNARFPKMFSFYPYQLLTILSEKNTYTYSMWANRNSVSTSSVVIFMYTRVLWDFVKQSAEFYILANKWWNMRKSGDPQVRSGSECPSCSRSLIKPPTAK